GSSEARRGELIGSGEGSEPTSVRLNSVAPSLAIAISTGLGSQVDSALISKPAALPLSPADQSVAGGIPSTSTARLAPSWLSNTLTASEPGAPNTSDLSKSNTISDDSIAGFESDSPAEGAKSEDSSIGSNCSLVSVRRAL